MTSGPEAEPLLSAIGFLVPELEALVGPWRARHDPSASQGVGAHVSLLVPFKPGHLITSEVIRELAAFFAQRRLPPLEFRGVCAFANALYLPPEPQNAVSEIITGLATCYPDTPPYGGAIPVGRIVPHVTVAVLENLEEMQSVTEAFCQESLDWLPITAKVREALLLVQDEDRVYRTRAVLPFAV